MKKLISTIGLTAMLLPTLASAAFIPGGSILSNIARTFGIAQHGASQLPESQKSSVSNVLKTKHDTVKNSINNVR